MTKTFKEDIEEFEFEKYLRNRFGLTIKDLLNLIKYANTKRTIKRTKNK